MLCPTQTNCGESGCLEESMTNYEGNDIQGKSNIPVADLDSCTKLCLDLPACWYWTFSPTQRRCWLKSSNARKSVRVFFLASLLASSRSGFQMQSIETLFREQKLVVQQVWSSFRYILLEHALHSSLCIFLKKSLNLSSQNIICVF